MKYKKIPGQEIKTIGTLEKNFKPTITIITPFYNGEKTLMATANSLFSQTYPYFEWIIINDGSTSKDAPLALENLRKMDKRVTILTKENGGPSQARDFGIKKASPCTKYVYFIDCDDIIENNMLEMMYWTLETHKEASFVYPSIINFGAHKYYWEPYFTLEEELVNNVLCINTMIKKEDLLEVGCFGIKEKAMYEDWNLWLKLLAKEKIPIRINPQSFWYRTSDTGELSRSKNNHRKAMALINETSKTVKKDVEVIQFPRMSVAETSNTYTDMILPEYKVTNSLLYIINNTELNSNNIKTYEILKRLKDQKYHITLVCTEPAPTDIRQDLQSCSTEFYDLSNFLDFKDYPLFINYLIKSRKVSNVITTDDTFGYALLPTIKEENPSTKIYLSLDQENEKISAFSSYIESIITTNEELFNKLKSNLKITLIKKDSSKNNKLTKVNKDKLKDKYSIPKDKIIISFLDNISFETRPQVFLNIVKALQDNDNLFFIMSGDGEMSKDVSKYSKLNALNNFLLLEEQEDPSSLIELSDLVINCASKEGISFISYQAASLGTPVISNNLKPLDEFLNTKCCELVEYMDSKNETDYQIYAEKYLEKINLILADLEIYQNNALDFASNNNAYFATYIEKLKELLQAKATNKTEVFNSHVLYSYYCLQLKDQFRSKYLAYYKDIHHIEPREYIDRSKFAIMKRRIRGFSLKHNIENEMHFIFLKLGYYAKTVTGLVTFIKNLVLSLIYLIPIIFMFIICLLKLFKQFLISLKN